MKEREIQDKGEVLKRVNVGHFQTDGRVRWGELIISTNYVFFKPGILGFSLTDNVEWIIPLQDIDDIDTEKKGFLETDQKLFIQTKTGGTESFQIIAGFSVDVNHLAGIIRTQRGLPPRRSPDIPLAPGHPKPSPQPTDDIDAFIIGIIKAFRTSDLIIYHELHELCKGTYPDVTLNEVKARLVRLISQERLSGYLNKEGYHRDVKHTIQCQVCDRQLINPVEYWQCPDCKRYICEDCKPQNPICPTHPKTNTTPVRMPIICPECQNPITNLHLIKNYECPHCDNPIPPP